MPVQVMPSVLLMPHELRLVAVVPWRAAIFKPSSCALGGHACTSWLKCSVCRGPSRLYLPGLGKKVMLLARVGAGTL